MVYKKNTFLFYLMLANLIFLLFDHLVDYFLVHLFIYETHTQIIFIPNFHLILVLILLIVLIFNIYFQVY